MTCMAYMYDINSRHGLLLYTPSNGLYHPRLESLQEQYIPLFKTMQMALEVKLTKCCANINFNQQCIQKCYFTFILMTCFYNNAIPSAQ
jgi:hypothetical protein